MRNWKGRAFEQVCFQHLPQIKKALGINGIQSDVCAWTQHGTEKNAQIDMLIDRADQTINLCEIKYSTTPFVIKKDYAEWMQERRDIFRDATHNSKAIHLTMITTMGVKQNLYSGEINSEVTLTELFKDS